MNSLLLLQPARCLKSSCALRYAVKPEQCLLDAEHKRSKKTIASFESDKDQERYYKRRQRRSLRKALASLDLASSMDIEAACCACGSLVRWPPGVCRLCDRPTSSSTDRPSGGASSSSTSSSTDRPSGGASSSSTSSSTYRPSGRGGSRGWGGTHSHWHPPFAQSCGGAPGRQQAPKGQACSGQGHSRANPSGHQGRRRTRVTHGRWGYHVAIGYMHIFRLRAREEGTSHDAGEREGSRPAGGASGAAFSDTEESGWDRAHRRTDRGPEASWERSERHNGNDSTSSSSRGGASGVGGAAGWEQSAWQAAFDADRRDAGNAGGAPVTTDPALTAHLAALGLAGVPATQQELKRAYQRAAKVTHPDLQGAQASREAFQATTEALAYLEPYIARQPG